MNFLHLIFGSVLKWELSTRDLGHFLHCNCLRPLFSLFLLFTPLPLTTPLSHTWLLFPLQNHYHWPMRTNVSGTLGTVRHHQHHHHHPPHFLSFSSQKASFRCMPSSLFSLFLFLFSERCMGKHTAISDGACVFASVFKHFWSWCYFFYFYLLAGIYKNVSGEEGAYSQTTGAMGLDRRSQLKCPKTWRLLSFLWRCCVWCTWARTSHPSLSVGCCPSE